MAPAAFPSRIRGGTLAPAGSFDYFLRALGWALS